jgi:hypothetical protein
VVERCVLHRLDGNGIMLSAYNQHANISHNTIVQTGGSAIAFWGNTVRKRCFLSSFYVEKSSLYQDRLGTHIGKSTQKRGRPLCSLARTQTNRQGAKTPFFSHFILKMIILPRQARDKHRKS